jgi:UDP-2,4-diacetamido-2,4,6-trideoxy-beta-L-altropyranose hydrolase
MRVVFRTDSSAVIGSGHVMRCLTLAHYLRKRQYDVVFICRDLAGNLSRRILDDGFELKLLPYSPFKAERKMANIGFLDLSEVDSGQDLREMADIIREIGDVEWLIVDHYDLDLGWESAMHLMVKNLLAIDDMNRHHDCDILLDYNLPNIPKDRYDHKVHTYCRKLLGLRYVLLRPEFDEARQTMTPRNGMIKRILIFFGASDVSDETTKTLRAIQSLMRDDLFIDVVLGGSYCNREEIVRLAQSIPHVTVHDHVSHMAEMMLAADLAIGAGGTTNWERCYLGLPTIAVIIADNQRPATEALDRMGALWSAGVCGRVTVEKMAEMIRFALEHDEAVRIQSQRALALFEGQTSSGCELVIDEMEKVAHARS